MIAEDQETTGKVTLTAVSLTSSRFHLGQPRFPAERANFVAVMYHKAKVLIMGGDMADREYNDIWELNLRTRTWRKLKKELREPIVGHKSVKLRVLSKESLVKGSGRGLLTYGGWQRSQYSDTLYLLDMYSLDLKECPRKSRSKLDDIRGPKSTFDTKKQIELELSIPEARRDHSMCFHDKSNVVVMIGGWNALEWHPDQVALEIWILTSDWRWKQITWEERAGIPLNRRGHTADYDPETNSIVLFGGMFGYSKFLGDCYQIYLDDVSWKARAKEIKRNPISEFVIEGRAWHTSTRIRRHIYYVGGMKELHNFASEVLVLNIDTRFWHRAVVRAPLLERCGHCAVRFGESIIILGGYTESSSESENDGFFESSLNSSRAASLNGVTKTSYFPLDEAVIIEIGHHVDNTSPELESTMGNRASAIQKP